MGIFNYDGPLMHFLNKLSDVIILNILFLICCIPIFTIGASCTAMYSVTLKMAKNEESYVAKSFFKSFKENFKISTVCWLIIAVIGVLLFIDYRIAPQMFPSISFAVQAVFAALFILLAIVFIYIFPYIARFENTIKNTFKNAVLIGILNLPFTLLMLVISIGVPVISSFIGLQISGIFWILLGFTLIAYVNSIFFRKIFYKYEPHEEGEPEDITLKDIVTSDEDEKFR